MKNLKREHYLQKIRAFKEKNLIKVLTGQRRVGKSFVLQQIKNEIVTDNPKANIIDVNLEKLDFIHIKDFKDLAAYIKDKSIKQTNYLFIDEIQEVQGFEKTLRSLLTENNYDIYCTGSNAKILSGELATLLSGRQIEIRIHSLSFTEFIEFYQKSPNLDALQQYLQFGGMPYLINLPNDEDIKNEYLKNIFTTILFRDVVARYEIRDVTFLENLMHYLADNTGSIVSASKISKYLKSQNINKTTQLIINYLSYIENTFCITKVRRTDIQGKKIFETGEKYYFEDIGIRNILTGFRLTDMNKILENTVYHHLVFCGYNVFIGKLSNLEIDFVAEKNNERYYIQVAYLLHNEQTVKREFGNLLKIQDNFPKYVVSMDTFTAPATYKGIKQLSLLDFLLNFI
ncbi:MAG: ATP-binding protein [Bacteroidales bacterium]|nr:ATP-binding protein [Bacteroidales bacterium]